jgi:signal transduction histidine kinase
LALHAALLIKGGSAERLLWINSILWFVAAVFGGIACAITARHHAGRARQAWWLLAAGCASWSLGQIGWTLAKFFPAASFPYPGPSDILFFGFEPLAIAGLLRLPKPQMTSTFSVKHFCNLALLLCTLITALVISLWEPGRTSALPRAQVVVHSIYCLSIGCVLIVALYLIWSYRWQATWWPLIFIALGAGAYTSSDIFYLRQLVANEYSLDDWINISWSVTFTLVAIGANEERWRSRHAVPTTADRSLLRERWLEAIMPGLLMLIIVGLAGFNVQWLSPQVLATCGGCAVFFAVMLAMRELYIQREEQRLLAALNASHAELEQRVSARTAELNDAYKELESFSYAVAHDIKAPLRAMNGFGALLETEYAPRLDDKGMSYVDRIRRGAVNLAQLVDDLLAYTRVERLALQRRPTNIVELLTSCINDHQEEIDQASAQVATHLEPITLNVDPQALTQSLRNLLQNALKFSRHAKPPRITIDSKRSGDKLRISIKDNGIGFDMQYHEQIFALFQRLHRGDEYPGTGIGLAIARKAVERMGGRLWAESQIGAGATFFIELQIQM